MSPFAPTVAGHQRLVDVGARFALAWACVYVAWRGAATIAGADLPAAGTLFAAELLAVVVFAARVRAARAAPVVPVEVPDVPLPDTTALIDATGVSAEDLRITLVSLGRVEGIEQVIVVDAEGSRWLRTIAERFGALVCEPSVTLVDAARGAGTSWVLLLRGGDLPMPDLVRVCAARCSDPTVAVVQVGVAVADPTSFEHEPDCRWSLEPFEQRVVRPSLAARGSTPWYGDGPAMARRSAFGEEGLRYPADSRELGLAVARRGRTVTHLPVDLVRVQGPQSLGEVLVRRHRALGSAFRAVRPRHLAGVPRATVGNHVIGATPVLVGLQRLLLVVSAVLVLGFGQVPLVGGSEVLALAVPSYLSRWGVHRLLGRGWLEPFSVLRSDLRAMGVDLLPIRPDPTTAARIGIGAVVAVIAVLHGVVIVTAVSLWRDAGTRLPAEVAAVALVLTAVFVGVAMEVLLDALARRQRRLGHRVRLGLVSCRVEEHDGQLLDLSIGGAGVSLPCEPSGAPAPGAVTTVSFRIPDACGAWRSVSALVHVAHRSPDAEGGTRLGLAFDDPTDAPLDPVVEFLTVDRRLLSLGGRELLRR